jgi:hypothetical protein
MLAVCATRADRDNTRRACAARSQWQWSRFSARAQNLQIVRVVHDPQDVSERVDHRSGNKPLFAVCGRLVLLRSHGQQLLERCCHIIDLPVHDNTARPGRRTRGRVFAIDQTQFVLVVAEAPLGILWGFDARRAFEVGTEA